MIGHEIDTVKLGPNEKPPAQDDLVAEIKREKSGGWTTTIVSGLLFKEQIPGTFNGIDEALGATVRYLSRSPRKRTLYYRAATGGRKVIKKTRYVRSR